jgi:hypothetical protein
MKRNLIYFALFLAGAGCFIYASFALVMGVAGVAHNLWRGHPMQALKIAGYAGVSAGGGFVLGALAVSKLRRMRDGELSSHGFDVLPPR